MGEDRGGDGWGGWQGYRVGGCYKLTLHVIKEDKMKNTKYTYPNTDDLCRLFYGTVHLLPLKLPQGAPCILQKKQRKVRLVLRLDN